VAGDIDTGRPIGQVDIDKGEIRGEFFALGYGLVIGRCDSDDIMPLILK
jgi:hypothetical protein